MTVKRSRCAKDHALCPPSMMIALLALVAPVPDPDPASETIIVRAERLVVSRPAQVTLSADDLAGTSGARLDEVLRIIPAFGLFRRSASGPANATIQGFSLRPIAPNGAGRAFVSLDNVPQNDPFGGWIYWGRYNPLFLDEVDVRRGGAAAQFGSMALTGSLDISEARTGSPRLSLSLGSNNAIAIAGRSTSSSAGANFTAMGAYEASDGAIPVAPGQRGRADIAADFEFAALTLVTDILEDNGAWSFRASGFSETKGTGLIGGQSGAQGLDVSAARRFDLESGQARVLVYAQGRDFSNLTVAANSARLATTPVLDQFATPASALGGSFAFAPSGAQFYPSISLDWRRTEGESQELFRFLAGDFTRSRIAGGRQEGVGVSASMPRPLAFLGDRLRLEAIVRIDYWANRGGFRLETDRATGGTTFQESAKDTSGTVTTGSVSLAQARGPLKLSLYRTFRPPNLNELHRPFRLGNDVTEANADLVPETLVGLDLDIRGESRLYGGELTSSLTFYVNRLDDPIANVTIGTGPGVFPRAGFLPVGGVFRQRRNVGRIDALGLEGRLSWQGGPLQPRFLVSGSYSSARVNGGILSPQLTGKRPAQAPNWSAYAGLTWPVSDRLSWGVTWRGESARYEDDLNTRALAAYGALDARLSWRITPRAEIVLSGENLIDSRVETARAVDGLVTLAQGRVVRLGISLGQKPS